MSRRAVTRGMVWSVPVIATALPAPAFAASCSTLYTGTTNWSDGTYSRASDTSSSGGFTANNGDRISVTFASTATGYTLSPNTNAAANLAVTNTVSGTNASGITLYQSATTGANSGNGANNQTVKVSFSRPVYNLNFLITDIDSSANFNDAVGITGTSFSFSIPAGSGSTVTGNGTPGTSASATGNPFRQPNNNTAADNTTGTGGNIQITIPGPVMTFNIVYYNYISGLTNNVNKQQAVFIGNMTASVHNAGCDQ